MDTASGCTVSLMTPKAAGLPWPGPIAPSSSGTPAVTFAPPRRNWTPRSDLFAFLRTGAISTARMATPPATRSTWRACSARVERSEVGSQRPEVRDRRSETGGQRPEVRDRRYHSPLITHHSLLTTHCLLIELGLPGQWANL